MGHSADWAMKVLIMFLLLTSLFLFLIFLNTDSITGGFYKSRFIKIATVKIASAQVTVLHYSPYS